MKLKSYNDFINEQKKSEELEWESKFPKVTKGYKIPEDQLYRWVVPGDIEEYLKDTNLEQSGIEDYCKDDEGNDYKCTGIPFFIEPSYFFGYGDPFVRIILDKQKLLDDGYTLFNPNRDEGERRIQEDIKNWLDYLINIEIYREAFVIKWDDEWDEPEDEFALPFEPRKEIWDTIVNKIPKDKIVIVDEDFAIKNIKF